MGKRFSYHIPIGDWNTNTYLYDALMKSIGGRASDEYSDLLLLPGGGDWLMNPMRDLAELEAYNHFTDRGKRVLGICRGAQLHCLFSGGKLIKHLPDWNDRLMHTTITGNWQGASAFHGMTNGSHKILVNSRHHQGFINIPNSNVIWTSDDGLAEGGYDEKCFWVQWHPEHTDMINTIAQLTFKNEFYEWFWN